MTLPALHPLHLPMSLQLAFVIDNLKEAPKSVVPILAILHAERHNLANISKVDLKHLTSRTLNLCKAADAYSIWSGVSIVHILVESVHVLASEGQAFFGQLVKILSSPFANDELILESTVECLNKLCASIRGKPTLTREVLTPHLSVLFSSYMARVDQNPRLMLSSLKTLIEEHPTTSRPFANKLKTKLLAMLLDAGFLNSPEALQQMVCCTLATLPIIEKDGPDVYWRKDVDRLVANIVGTVDVYSSFLKVDDDPEVSVMLKRLGKDGEPEIFLALHIDINQPMSILRISDRMELLLKMLLGYLFSGCRFAVPVPIGQILAVIELVCSVNPSFLLFKGDIRDLEIRDMVQMSLGKCYEAALLVLADLPIKYSGVLIPHLSDVFAVLELLVFLHNKHLDKARILQFEPMFTKVICCATEFLRLSCYFPDYPSISRIVDVALFLVLPRSDGRWLQNLSEASKTKLSQSSKAARKKAKKNASIPLSDLLSHVHLFENNVPAATRRAVFDFLAVVIKCAPLPSTQFNKFLKLVIVDAVRSTCTQNYGAIPADIERLLLTALLHPAPESASILPIVTSLLPQSELLEIFTHPRFPPLPVMALTPAADGSDEEEDDAPSASVLARPTKKQKVSGNEESPASPLASQVVSEDIFTVKSFPSAAPTAEDVTSTRKDILLEDLADEAIHMDAGGSKPAESLFTETVQTQAEKAQPVAKTEAVNTLEENLGKDESDSEDEAQIEVPDLNLEDSDEEN